MTEIATSILQTVYEELHSPWGRDRLAAVRELAPAASDPQIAQLLRDLSAGDPDPRVRIVAGEVVNAAAPAAPENEKRTGSLGPWAGDPNALRESLADPRPLARLELLESLLRLGPGANPELAGVLERHLEEAKEPLEAAATLRARARLGGSRLAPLLEKFLNDARPRVVAAAADLLAEHDAPAVFERLEPLLGGEPTLVRRTAARLMASNNPEKTLALLAARLADPADPGVRERAQDALAAIGSPEAYGLLAGSLASEPEITLVERAAEVLGRSGKKSVLPLLAAAKTLPPERSQPAMQALEALRQSLGMTRSESQAAIPAAAAPPIRVGRTYRGPVLAGGLAIVFLLVGLRVAGMRSAEKAPAGLPTGSIAATAPTTAAWSWPRTRAATRATQPLTATNWTAPANLKPLGQVVAEQRR